MTKSEIIRFLSEEMKYTDPILRQMSLPQLRDFVRKIFATGTLPSQDKPPEPYSLDVIW